jgi:pimeloyl-ACP methyl ester carboxylesterase
MPMDLSRWPGPDRRVVLLALATASLLWPTACRREPQAEMINVGDHALALMRAGKGDPIVVYESGAGPYSGIASGEKIRSHVGAFTSVVTYARAGRSPSEPSKSPRTLPNVVEDLHVLLGKAGCRPPYVLVGASLGGVYVRAFAMMHPDEVAGLVLVEGTHERLWLEGDRRAGLAPGTAVAGTIGVLRSRNDVISVQEMEELAPVWATGKLGISGQMPDVPMAVITGMKPDRPPEQLKVIHDLHGELLAMSTRGRHFVTDRSGHNVNSTEPELVATAVRWVVDAVRAQSGSR